ncbi:MAG TPA: 4-alpha-glucanotransferase [Acidobacteriaceae bacterium]|jgi:4-alpha-glucanotransferase|nr:4-alpha-glucanotransferase [Acidobacteriaceae bacterium]
MPFERSSGLLLHIASLPSFGGIGDLGPAAYAFADFLAASKQRLWQVLPLGPTGYGNSPYAALSAFAGNPLLISLEFLADRSWIGHDRLADLAGRAGDIDHEAVAAKKLPLLEEAARNFLRQHDSGEWSAFEGYCHENATWLNDWALYVVLRRKLNYASWNDWPSELKHREPATLDRARLEHGGELAVAQALQFAFNQQWRALRDYCGARDIRFIGDIAIFVNYDSADTWTHPELFELDKNLAPIRVAGVPPDYFSATGQRWGNPLYKWDVLQQNGFGWWVDRIRRAQFLYDVIRLDHFRGFEAYWAIPASDETAVNGTWVKGPGTGLFQRLHDVLGDLPFIAEDLGMITKEVDALREQFHLPGMKVLQFGFSGRGAHMHLPHQFVTNSVAYTGTHDNDTTRGWWEHGTSETERAAVQAYLGTIGNNVVWPLIRATATSVADIALYPVQDILELGSEARMNVPSRATGNWSWRCPENTLTPELAQKLGALTEVTDRDKHERST